MRETQDSVEVARKYQMRKNKCSRMSLEDKLFCLFVSINHYIETGDQVGQGWVLDGGDWVLVLLPVEAFSDEDKSNFACLESRLDELNFKFFDSRTELIRMGYHDGMDLFALRVRKDQVYGMSRFLVSEPGLEGWGTAKEYVDQMAGQEYEFKSKDLVTWMPAGFLIQLLGLDKLQ